MADIGAPSCSIVDPLAPGVRASADPLSKFAVQPAGTVGAIAKFEVPHVRLLRFVTDTIRFVSPPGSMDACEGETDTSGAAGVHGTGAAPKLTKTFAPPLPADNVVMLMPVVRSVKVLPTPNAASVKVHGVVTGVRS